MKVIVMLIVELVALWFAISVAIGLPLGSRIRRADAAEFPLRRETAWWLPTGSASELADIPCRVSADRPALVAPSPFLELELELALGPTAGGVPALR